MRLRLTVITLACGGMLATIPSLQGQVRPVYDLGAAGLVQTLERLLTTASVLHTGAHPDDEDSAFLARAARGDHARVAYLSLNRGEGGQNIIGPELFEALGVIRTEELLQARRLDGGEQFFTRTLDYGFSKTRAEAAAKWNEREVLGDMVRIIRLFRPVVVYARFSGTSTDGHGQHQLAGYLTPQAYRAAGDPTAFPEQLAEGLRPWQPRKLYRQQGRGDADPTGVVQVQTGIVDPVIGRSFAAIAAEGRSQHKSQEMGTIEPLGPASANLRLVESVAATATPERSIFDGVDVSVPGLGILAGLPADSLRSELTGMEAAARRALREFAPLDPASLVPTLAEGVRLTRAARNALAAVAASPAARADADFLLTFKEQDFVEALLRAAGVIVDPLADAEVVAPGSAIDIGVRVFASNPAIVRVTGSSLHAPDGWTISPAVTSNDAGFRRETPAYQARYRVAIPANAPLTQPYFLVEPRDGDKYRWPARAAKGLPFDPPLFSAQVTLEVGGVSLSISRPVQYRTGDRVRGELRRDVNVVPAIAVSLDTRLLVVPTGGGANQQRVVVRALHLSDEPVSGALRLRLPAGWSATPAEAPFTLRRRDESTSAAFVITAPARRTPGQYDVVAEAVAEGTVFSRDLQVIAYPHIQTHRSYRPAKAVAQVLDLKVASVRVGYVMGSGDEVPDALRRLGLAVRLIDNEMLATGDLSQFDTIVVGVRASEARPDFVANNGRLIDFMQRGGTLIVQYQQQEYTAANLPPYPAQAPANSRVTEETAPVRILTPTHPVFTFPNRITAADFDGWVQERNLYAFNTFDARYTPLLESADTGEPPQHGAHVYAAVGKGHYVYTAYSWFRQLPAGVPGAYRQFANLVSLPKAPRP